MTDNPLDYQEIYEAFQPKIVRYLTHMVGENEAEDLTQEVFVKVSHALPTFRGECKLATWLYRIATNAALDRVRSPSFRRVAQECSVNSPNGQDEGVSFAGEFSSIGVKRR